MSNSLRPHGLKPARLPCPWDFPGKNTGVGCHSLLQGIFQTQGLNLGLLHCSQILNHLTIREVPGPHTLNVCVSHSVMSDSLWPHGLYSLLGSSVHGILQARILEWVAIPFSRESSQPRNQTQVSYIAGGFFNSLLSEPPRSLSMPISINLYLLLSVVAF